VFYNRLVAFAGLLNGILVLGTGLVFGYLALEALSHSASIAGDINPTWILVAAVPTLALRMINLRVLGGFRGRVRDLNLRSVLVHLASDVAITGLLLFAAAALFVNPGYVWADSAAALIIAGILVYESVPLLRGGWEVLTERTPQGLSVDTLTRAALAVPGVTEVHDVHVWAICDSLVCLTAHVGVREMTVKEGMGVVRQLRETMERDFGIVHSTFEIESR